MVVFFTLHVDDLLLLRGDGELLETLKQRLLSRFKMKDMDNVSLVLGMQVTRECEKGTLTISQEDYTKSVLERFGKSDCKPPGTPRLAPSFDWSGR